MNGLTITGLSLIFILLLMIFGPLNNIFFAMELGWLCLILGPLFLILGCFRSPKGASTGMNIFKILLTLIGLIIILMIIFGIWIMSGYTPH